MNLKSLFIFFLMKQCMNLNRSPGSLVFLHNHLKQEGYLI